MINMRENFDKYLMSKIVLSKMVAQFYSSYISVEEADELNIEYNEGDIKNNYIECIFNNFLPEGNYIWNLLDIKKDVITFEEIWNKMDEIREEAFDKEKDYYKIYLNNALLIIDMVKTYYNHTISVNQAKKYNLNYVDLDEFDDRVMTCFHEFEGAGESAWYLLGINKPIIARSEIDNIQNNIKKEIMKSNVKLLQKSKIS